MADNDNENRTLTAQEVKDLQEQFPNHVFTERTRVSDLREAERVVLDAYVASSQNNQNRQAADNKNDTPAATTFEQWLAAQTNLTDAQRQALRDHNADAAVTFTPEGFDQYLESLRAPADDKPQGNENKTYTDEEYRQAADLVKGDLNELNFEQIQNAWQVLSTIDEVTGQQTRPNELQAKLKMQDFAEAQMAAVNPDQPWSMENAPEYSEWLKVSNDVQAHNNNQEKKDRNAKIGESLNKFYQEFDKENGLEHLDQISAETIAANQADIEAMGQDFDPFAKDAEGNLVNPEFASMDAFYDKLDIDNSNKDADEVSKEGLKHDMAELAYNETLVELSVDPEFNKLSPEDKKKRFSETYASHMQTGALNIIATQMAENASKADPENKHTAEEFALQAQDYLNKTIDKQGLGIRVTNTAALSVLSARTTNVEHVSKRIAQKTGHKSLWGKIKDFDKRMAKKYPKSYPFLKNLAISSAIGLASGGVGLTALSAYKSLKAIKKSYKAYKENNKEGEYKSYFGYLRKNPKEAIGLAVSIAGTAMSGYMVGMNGIDVNDFGLGGQAYQNGLGNTWDSVKQTVSNAFSSPEAAKDVPWTERFTSWGKRVAGQVNNTLHDGNAVTRMGISLSGGISSGAIDMMASFREKDPEKKKQLRKNAWKAFGGVVMGSMASLGFSAFMKANNPDSPLPHNSPVDGDDFKPEVIHHDKPIGPEEYDPNNPELNKFAPDHQPDHQPDQPHHNPVNRHPAPSTPEPVDPLDVQDEPIIAPEPVHIYSDQEKALFEELKRGHMIGSGDAKFAEEAAARDMDNYLKLKEEGNIGEAGKLLETRHNQFERAEREAGYMEQEGDSRKLANARADAAKAYEDYKAAAEKMHQTEGLAEDDPERVKAMKEFDKAARNVAHEDVDKTKLELKSDIKDLKSQISRDESLLDKVGAQKAHMIETVGTDLKGVDAKLQAMGIDPANLPEDISKLPPEAKDLLGQRGQLAQMERLENGLRDRLNTNQENLGSREEALKGLKARDEDVAGMAVDKHVAGYGDYHNSEMHKLHAGIVDDKIAQDMRNGAGAGVAPQTDTAKLSEEAKAQMAAISNDGNKEPLAEDQKTTTPEDKTEQKEEVPPVSKEQEDAAEAQKRLQDIKDRTGMPEDNGNTAFPEEHHVMQDGGVYSIKGDENSFDIAAKNISVNSEDMDELRKYVKTDAADGKNYLNGKPMGNGLATTMALRGLAKQEKIYDDLLFRESSGESLSDAEKLYISSHERNLAAYGLAHDEKGNIVKNTEHLNKNIKSVSKDLSR